jgi:hypothetical protein
MGRGKWFCTFLTEVCQFLKNLLSHSDINGACVKAVLENGEARWSKHSCSDVTGRSFVCQRRQNIEDVGEHRCADIHAESKTNDTSVISLITRRLR